METSTNLKRWRDSGETNAKKTVYRIQHSHRITTASTWSHTTVAPYTIFTTGTPIIISIGKIPSKIQQTPLQTLQLSLQHEIPFSPTLSLSLSLSLLPGCAPDLDPSIDSQTTTPQQESPRSESSKARPRAKSASSKEDSQELFGAAWCPVEVEEFTADFQLRRALKPLLNFKQIKSKDISNP